MACYQEMAVTIEKDIEDLNCFKKLDQFIVLYNHYHMNCCEIGIDCKNHNFLMNLRYLYVEILISGQSIEKLQKYCRFKYRNFYSIGPCWVPLLS